MSTRRSTLCQFGLVLGGMLAPQAAVWAQTPAPAIDGFDPVAYFTEKRPVKGLATISHDWDGQRYFFATSKHRDLFVASPQRYEPQFNGLCAGNVSLGNKVKADPTIWRVVDGKLYVFAKQQGSDEAVAGKVAVAQGKWKDLK